MELSHYTYLAVDCSAVIVPLLAGFHRKIKFYSHPFTIVISLILAGLPFILADHVFTHMGVWGFNPTYITGNYIFNLPIEEYLFFLCIPFSCLFTFHCFRVFNIVFFPEKIGKIVAIVLSIFLLLAGVWFYDLWYTGTTCIAAAIAILTVYKVFPTFHFARFFSMFLIILIPFFICNGILTGSGLESPVVWYNNQENLGIRMFTIPVEDTFYGMLLLFLGCVFYEKRMQGKELPKR